MGLPILAITITYSYLGIWKMHVWPTCHIIAAVGPRATVCRTTGATGTTVALQTGYRPRP